MKFDIEIARYPLRFTDIEAESEEAATQIARELFKDKTNGAGVYEVVSVEEITE